MVSWAMVAQAADYEIDARGRQFVAFDSFGSFAQTDGSHPGEKVFTSPVIVARINFEEVIVSWNAETAEDSYVVVEARALYTNAPTKYYKMGFWSANPARHP